MLRESRGQRGTTLVEVLTACVCLALLMTCIITLYRLSSRTGSKMDVETDAYRAAMVGLEHVKSQLRGAEVLNPLPGSPPDSKVSFRYPRVENQRLVVDAVGLPVWAGSAELALVDHKLVRAENGKQRVLADLGASGSVTFERLSDALLRVTVLAAWPDPDPARAGHYEARVDLFLGNQ